MLIKDIPKKDCLKLKECIGELMPSVKVNLIAEDTNLHKLGFTNEIMCTVELNLSDEQREELIEMCIDFETDAFMYEPVDEQSEAYKNYVRYSWIVDFFYGLKD